MKAPITPLRQSLAYSRLSLKEISRAPLFADLWPNFLHLFSNNILISHNKIYETNVLKNEFSDLGINQIPPFICTLYWARKILKYKVNSHDLETLCSYFEIPLESPHEAISDARATSFLFRKLFALSADLKAEVNSSQGFIKTYESLSISHQPLMRERFKLDMEDDGLIENLAMKLRISRKRLVVITGTPNVGKEDFAKFLITAGFEYRETPTTQATAFVVQASIKPGMSKIRRAQELGVPIISESQAMELIKKMRD